MDFSDELLSGLNEGVGRGEVKKFEEFLDFELVHFGNSFLPFTFGEGQKCRELVDKYGIGVVDGSRGLLSICCLFH